MKTKSVKTHDFTEKKIDIVDKESLLCIFIEGTDGKRIKEEDNILIKINGKIARYLIYNLIKVKNNFKASLIFLNYE